MKRTSKKKENLTLKQSRFVKELPKSKSVAEAGAKAGYYDRPTAHRALKSISERAPEVLERIGLTIEHVANNCLRPLLEATETKFFANQGIVMEEKIVKDSDIRLRAIDIWAKLKGAYSTQKVEVSGSLDHHVDLSEVPDAVLQRIVQLAEDRPAGSGQSKG